MQLQTCLGASVNTVSFTQSLLSYGLCVGVNPRVSISGFQQIWKAASEFRLSLTRPEEHKWVLANFKAILKQTTDYILHIALEHKCTWRTRECEVMWQSDKTRK